MQARSPFRPDLFAGKVVLVTGGGDRKRRGAGAPRHAAASTTEELQAALADAIGSEIVDPAFDKYVYGKGSARSTPRGIP